jgi:hypothetical protein
MKTITDLNTEWIEACKVMQIINKQRIQIYKQWKAIKESEGTDFGDEFPLMQDIQPSIDYDLSGELIDDDN